MSIYKHPEGRAAVLKFYDEALARMVVPWDDLYAETRFGSTHVLAMGPADAPPILIFHGGNVVNPVSLRWFVPLMKEYRIYAPDTIGHPGKSAETRLSPNSSDYGLWAADAMDRLGLERAAVIGPSYGGGIALRLAAHAPDRISALVLVVSSSIVTSLWRMTREIVLPMLMYMVAPTPSRLVAAELLAGSRHYLSRESHAYICGRRRTFLTEGR